MTLEKALEASIRAATTGKMPFRPMAYIKELHKLPIYAYSREDLHYNLTSKVGDVGFDCNFLLAKWKLRKRVDWQPKLAAQETL